MKKFLISFLCCIPLFAQASNIENAPEGSGGVKEESQINYNLNINDEIEKEFEANISINTSFKMDLSRLNEKLKILSPEKNYSYLWSIVGAGEQNGPTLERTFKEKGEKEIYLRIKESSFENNQTQEKTLYEKKFKVLVFEKSMPLVYSDEMSQSDVNNYVNFAKKDGIYIYEIGPLNKSDIELNGVLNTFETYEKIPGLKSDFIVVWGNREFIFNILSKINREVISGEKQKKVKYNIISISPYNINVLNNYLKNFLANKSWINKLILMNEDSKFNIIKQSQISELKKDLEENQYEFIDVNLKNNEVNNSLFISKFINNLSNLGYSTDNIYIFLIIPIILTTIILFKHFIGFSPIGLIIPLFITLLMFKLGFVLTLGLIFTFIAVNLGLSFFIAKYNLLYAPKITFMLIINMILFIFLLNFAYTYQIIPITLNDSIYFIIFILVCEKFINIIVSKDLLEYKNPFFFSLLIAIVSYFLLSQSIVKTITLAYPEYIILLIPFSFMIGRFTGLRVTEYFRFREIIKNIEE